MIRCWFQWRPIWRRPKLKLELNFQELVIKRWFRAKLEVEIVEVKYLVIDSARLIEKRVEAKQLLDGGSFGSTEELKAVGIEE